MSSTIMNVYGSLQAELERAKEDLKGVEENIKKIIGRDPNDGPPSRLNLKRTISTMENSDDFEPEVNMVWRVNQGNGDFLGKGRKLTISKGWQDSDPRQVKIKKEEGPGLSIKRRLGETKTVFSRLSAPSRTVKKENDGDKTFLPVKPVLPSQVIVTPREVPSRKDVLAAQGNDESSKARNRRMFGALLGTLQKFRQEETRLKDREQKKAQVEKKLEEAAIREKEELKRERQELFQNRKRRQADIRNIELKMIRIQEQEEWETSNKHLKNFIQTRAKPHLFYLPKKHNKQTEERLVASQALITKMIEKKRAEVQEEVAAILRRNKNKSEAETEKPNDVDMNEDLVDKENQVIASDLSSVKVEKITDDAHPAGDKPSPAVEEVVVSEGQVVKTENVEKTDSLP